MVQVSSLHPPGMVVVVTGELTRYAKFMQDLNRLRVPQGSDLVWSAGPSVKRNIDRALTRVLREPTAQWAWMIGDDHSFHPNIVLDLLDRKVDCVLPVCLARTPPFVTTLRRGDKNLPLVELPEGLHLLAEDESMGDAGMLMQRKVIGATGPPWQDIPSTGSWDVEDRIFVDRVRERGYDVHLDTEAVLGHITPCEIIPNGKKVQLKFAKRVYAHDPV